MVCSGIPRMVHRYRLILIFGIVFLAWAWGGVLLTSADGPIQVGLYIQFEDGSTFEQCVELDGVGATGLDVLRQSDVDLIFEAAGSFGSTVCKIGETGCNYPAENCFCQCLGTPCEYWNYWYEEDGQWKYSPLGASIRTVSGGDVEGWVWGNGQQSPPVEVLSHDICPVAVTATPTPLEKPGSGSTPPSTLPSITLTPTQTPLIAEAESVEAPSSSPSPVTVYTDAPNPTQPVPPVTSTGGGLPTFMWLIIGLSGLGVVLLGLAYFVTRRQT